MPLFVMVDLETMGNGPDAAICSIGAVKFDPDGSPDDDKEFYAHVDLQSSQQCGGSIDAATVMWWLGQSAQATTAITRQDDAVPIGLALLNFGLFYGVSDGVWAAPAVFDIPILESAMRRMQPDRHSSTVPWTIRQIHCWSTVRRLLKIPKAPNTEAHHALADARAQVVAFRQGWHKLKKANLL